MSTQDIELTLLERKVQGKQVKQLRHDGLIPAVIHDHGKASKVVMAPYSDLLKVYRQAGKHHVLALVLGKETYTALIKDVDFDPKKQQMRHVVFNAVKQDEKVQTEVPVHLSDEIPAVKAGLMVITNLDTVEIEALPKDLIDEITVDASSLAEIGDKITVSELIVPEGVSILTDPEHPIATVEETKEQISEAAEETEEGEGAEGEETAEGEEAEVEGGAKTKESGEEPKNE